MGLTVACVSRGWRLSKLLGRLEDIIGDCLRYGALPRSIVIGTTMAMVLLN